jgi:hypothetical protein
MKHRSENGHLPMFGDAASDEKIYWHLYDQSGCSILSFFDFIAHRIDVDQARKSEVENSAYTLRMWFEHLLSVGTNQFSARDQDIKDFRERLMARKSSNLKGNDLARRRTVNLDLRVIYKYYEWLQRHHSEGRKLSLLGTSGCNINSALLEMKSESESGRNKRCYPLLLKNTGKSSKHKIAHIPTNQDREETTDYFHATQGPGTASRNVLMRDIAAKVGLRRNSILSLNCSEFTQELFEKHERTNRPYLVAPNSQKNDYDNYFEFRFELVLRIIDYINGYRAEIIARTGSSSDRLFLNTKNGKPLTSGGTSNIYCAASRALDHPKDFGLHGQRRSFANEEMDTSYQASVEVGGDTSIETLSALTASAMGHSSTASQETYLRNMLNRFEHTHAAQQRDDLARLQDINARLRAELALARKGK